MPYARSLQEFSLPEWFVEPPEAWERRLREISPVTDKLSHLRFRYFGPQPHWFEPNRGIWALYACTPRAQVTADRSVLFEKHWSELPKRSQMGRKSTVSSYQHFLWHTQGVDGFPFWILQGDWGGTACKYTRREVRYLDGCGALSEVIPLGFFPSCPFDQRAVDAVAKRDRFYQVGQRLDELEKLDRPDALKAEDELAEREFRERWLDTWFAMMQPQAEFMKSYLRKSESTMALPDAPDGLNNAVAQWKEHYVEHGAVIGAQPAASRALAVAIP